MLLLYASETKEKETPPFRSGPDTATPTDGVGHRRRGIGGLHFPSPALRLSGEALWRGPLAAENKCAGKRGEWRVPGNGNGDGGEEEGLWLASRHAIPPPPPQPTFRAARRRGNKARLGVCGRDLATAGLATAPVGFSFLQIPPGFNLRFQPRVFGKQRRQGEGSPVGPDLCRHAAKPRSGGPGCDFPNS